MCIRRSAILNRRLRLDIERIIERNPRVLSRLEDFYERRAKDTIMKMRARHKNN